MASYRITYTDGRTEDVTWRPVHTLQIERKWPKAADRPHYEAECFGLWCAAGKPDEFDAWMDSLESYAVAEVAADPPSGPPAGTSPD